MKCFVFAGIFVIFCVRPCLLWGEDGNYEEVLQVVSSFMEGTQTYTIPKDNSAMLSQNTEIRKDYKTINDAYYRSIDDEGVCRVGTKIEKFLEVLQKTSNTPQYREFGTFDFIIVGAGAAGAVIANRLSEIAEWRILLLEAGGPDVDFTKIPGLSSFLVNSDLNWGYNSTTQTHGCLAMKDRVCSSAHGKALGGSTTIHACVYARGNAKDYNRWVNNYGSQGWSYDEVLPYFKKSENAVFQPQDEEYHGVGGYVTTSHGSEIPELDPFLIRSYKELGNNYVDHNGQNQIGVAQMQLTIKGNERADTARSFLRAAENRSNLVISQRSFVTKVLINKFTKTADGVKFVKNGTKFIARAAKEVIVSAGAYNSAQLLMLSGIGPKNHLAQHNISVIEDLPVGQRLKDHPLNLGVRIKTNKVFYNQTFEEMILAYTQHLGSLTLGFGATNLAFWNTNVSETVRPNIEYIFASLAPKGSDLQRIFGIDDAHAAVVDTVGGKDIWVSTILLHPKSTGSVTLKSNSPVDHPLIDPNILSHPDDVEVMSEAIQHLLKLNDTKTFKEFGAEIGMFDAPLCNSEKYSKEWIACAIQYWTTTVYHPVGTNAMGPHTRNSVVNSRLEVHKLKNLRVADASVMPEEISGHTVAATMMIGEKVSDMIKLQYGEQ